MARPSTLSSMSVKLLFKLRDDVAKAITQRTVNIQRQLSALTGDGPKRGRPPGKRGRKLGKVAPQFRSKKDPNLTWSGRGATPRWIRAEMKGTKLTKESFRIK